MSVTIVYDNNSYDERLKTEWGFACWVEYGEHTILFDTGGDGTILLRNMETLELDPRRIEIVVLSHEHGDHTGGLDELLALHSKVKVFMPHAFPSSLKRQVETAGAELVEVSEPVEILPGLHSTGEMGSSIIEQAMIASSGQGLVVITGCAHPGIVQMVEQARAIGQDDVHMVFGGFHLGNSSAGGIDHIVDEFRRLGVARVGPTHCSGDRAREIFAEAYGHDYLDTGAGWGFTIENSP
jgi:7,8-dihydropterin-6-yl-methyl-4-(beta-D-ribofuranosyl)aminobenzene 5'-phosphate synthase